MPAPIVVELYSPQPRPQEVAALIAACTRAATPNECVSADARGSETPLGVAIVRREGDRARIELGLRSVVSSEWSTRDLVFQPGDDELERYRAIGFAIGTLVARRLEPPSPSATPSAPPASPPAAAVPPPSADRAPPPPEAAAAPGLQPRATWVDLAGGFGLGLVPGSPRAGATLRASSELAAGGVFGVAETGYAESTGGDGLRVRWLSLALGLGHPLGLRVPRMGVDARLLLVVERLSFTASAGERSDAAARWKPGLTAALDAHWQVAAPLALVISAATHLDPQRTVIRAGGDHVGETPALGLTGFVGLRLKLR